MLQRGIERVGDPVDPKEVLPEIEDRTGPSKKMVSLQGFPVNLKSRRLFIFKTKGLRCVNCGIRGEYFRIEKFAENTTYHLNLYAVHKGLEILMTRDHVWARGLGGSDSVQNQVTMCHLCNREKSQKESNLANRVSQRKEAQKKKESACRPNATSRKNQAVAGSNTVSS